MASSCFPFYMPLSKVIFIYFSDSIPDLSDTISDFPSLWKVKGIFHVRANMNYYITAHLLYLFIAFGLVWCYTWLGWVLLASLIRIKFRPTSLVAQTFLFDFIDLWEKAKSGDNRASFIKVFTTNKDNFDEILLGP